MRSLVMLALLVTAACAQVSPPSTLELSKNMGGVLLVVNVANTFKPEYQATSMDLSLKRKDVEQRVLPAPPHGRNQPNQPDPNPPVKYSFSLIKQEEQSSTFVLFVPITAGNYVIEEVAGFASHPPVMGAFQIPVGGKVNIQAGRVTYLGHVDAINRERKSDQEPRSGPVIPLVEQEVSGFANATLDLTIRDARAEDCAMIQNQLTAVPPDKFDTALVTIERQSLLSQR